ncbi:hypothetical protein GCM10011515_14400 [Tsuneonella deserti]|uniref:Uncharacterized protein n=1 Tax=Tsuneonella deserti TaxID=2035528 RepID=A0ABQ1S8Q1_9SPHN|nr:hypothetical protein GCM10011515_14400 [Tsuneonella deserti]
MLTDIKSAARRVTRLHHFRLQPKPKSGAMDNWIKVGPLVEIRTLADEVSSAGVFRIWRETAGLEVAHVR